MTGGIQVMLGLTGGFIWGFPVLAVLSGLASGALASRGIPGFRTGCGPPSGGTSVFPSFRQYVSDVPYAGVRPLSGEDLLSVAGAYLVSLALKKALKANFSPSGEFMTVKIRAHHLFCMTLYEGKGYSAFVSNMDRITERIRNGT